MDGAGFRVSIPIIPHSITCSARPPKRQRYVVLLQPADGRRDASLSPLKNFDRPTRKKAYDSIEALLTREVPTIPIWWPRQIQPVNPDLKNFTPNPVTADWNAYQWDI